MIFFVILIILACAILGLIILVQNPKGGGLAGNVGGFSNQLMGVKQTTDVLEKGTWVFAVVVALLCFFSTVFVPRAGAGSDRVIEKVNATAPMQQAPMQQVPAGSLPAAPAQPTK
ncbi:MAG TPA: preprotein translocase subunit SecG [Puia sp.]|jgi:preprotein translocase subunit SecG|nr:preprotein translocase subunit SecG [Puia sp.]